MRFGYEFDKGKGIWVKASRFHASNASGARFGELNLPQG